MAQADHPPVYRLVRSQRKTLAIEVHPGREVIVRAPNRLPIKEIEAFVASRQDWILAHWQKPRPVPERDFSPLEEAALRDKARQELPPLIAHYGGLLGVMPRRMTITGARTRFGSCSAKGGVSFSYRLMAYPREAVEYVVLHELAHLKQLNHSPAFYAIIARHMPDYKRRAAILKRKPQTQP